MKSFVAFIVMFIIIIIILVIFFHHFHIFEAFTPIVPNKPTFAAKTDRYNKPFILDNLIDKDLCQKIINQSVDKLVDSEIISGKHKSVRNSQQYWINKNDPMVKPLFEQISSMFNIPFENAEHLQVVRYLPNQYYNEHHDSCCDDNKECADFVQRGGQRVLTVLIYLNNEFTDGQTFFPKLDLKIKPPSGSAIVFYPLAMNSDKCHPHALHAGTPVTSGEKWIANLWYRQQPFPE